MRTRLTVCAALAALALTARSAAAEDVANPEYQDWSRFKVGAFASYTMTSEAAGNTSTTKMTHKLVELTAEKAVVETTMSISAQGMDMAMPAQKREVPAKVAKVEPTEAPKDAPKPTEGDEEVVVGDKKIACHWVEMVLKTDTMTTTTKTWTSKEVPTGLVKMEGTTEMAGVKSVTRSTLTSFGAGA